MTITAAILAKVAGTKTPGKYASALASAFNAYAAKYGVTAKADIAMALANFTVETGGFNRMDENLNYSAKRLMQVWPSRFPTLASTKGYANNPKALANKVYGGRMGNAGKPDAGWRYRGSGPGQVTGFDNFAICERLTKRPFTKQPDLMRDPDAGTEAALALWQDFGMSKFAKTQNVTAARTKWNGGTHGLDQVAAAFKRAMKLDLSVPAAQQSAPVVNLKPVEQTKFVMDKATVATVQQMLWDKGYTEIGSRRPDGTFDGDKGKLTDAAILAAKNENGFTPLDDDISPEFLSALPSFPNRRLAAERANATPAEVAAKVPEARANWWGQAMNAVAGFFSTIAAALFGVFQYFGVAKETVDQLKEYAADIPGEVWLGMIGVIALGMALLHRYGLNSSTEAFKKAERR